MPRRGLPVPMVLLALGTLAGPSSGLAQPSLEVHVDFAGMAAGASVRGPGVVHPFLTIGATNDVVVIRDQEFPAAYAANLGDVPNVVNACLAASGSPAGFSDLGAGTFTPDTRLHDYRFSFAPGVTVSEFSVRMLDYGDFNPFHATSHAVTLVAYDTAGNVVDRHQLAYTSDAGVAPRSGSAGDLRITGDACTAEPGEPGNFTFRVAGHGIATVAISYAGGPAGRPTDPIIAFKDLQFVLEPTVQVDVRGRGGWSIVDLGAHGALQVAIFGSERFDAATIVLETLSLAGAPVERRRNGTAVARLEDVDGDGRLDLVAHFRVPDLEALPAGPAGLVLFGQTTAGPPLIGQDTVRIRR